MSDSLTHGSLFAGIGGWDLGLESLGVQTIWQVEKDPYARQVLARHWPSVRRHDDVRTFPAGEWETPDIISGSFPCQDLSTAGKMAGLQGARSGLWYEMLRIVSWMRPRWVVIENTFGAWRRWVPTVRRGLWHHAYASVFFRVRACDFGLPHRRSRAVILAHLDGFNGHRRGNAHPGGPEVQEQPEGNRGAPSHAHGIGGDWLGGLCEAVGQTGGDAVEGGQAASTDPVRERCGGPGLVEGGPGAPQGGPAIRKARTVADVDSLSAQGPSESWQKHDDERPVEPCLVRGVHVLPHRVDRIRALGNAFPPVMARWVGERILEWEGKAKS